MIKSVLLPALLVLSIAVFNTVSEVSALPTGSFRVQSLDGDLVVFQWNTVSGADPNRYSVERSCGTGCTTIIHQPTSRTAEDYHGGSQGDRITYNFLAYDNDGDLVGKHSITITVPANNPPAVSVPQSVVAYGTELVEITARVTDESPNYLRYSWSVTGGNDNPVWITGASWPTVSMRMPDVNNEKSIILTLVVTDISGQSVTNTINITLMPTKNILPNANAGVDFSVIEGHKAFLHGGFSSDKDGTIDSYDWVRISGSSVTINNSSSQTADFIAPHVSRDTVLTFRLTVTDNDGGTDTDDIRVTVQHRQNDPPTADAGSDIIVAPGASVTLNGSGSRDRNDDPLTYQWYRNSGPSVTLTDSDKARASFTAPDTEPHKYVFRLVVTDDERAQSTDTVTVIVSSHDAPTANVADKVITVFSGEAVTLDASESVTHTTNASFRWTQTEGPTVGLRNSNTSIAAFTAPNVTGQAQLTFEVAVTDSFRTDTETVRVIVAKNERPTTTLSVLADHGRAYSGQVVKMIGYAHDVNGLDTLSFSWNAGIHVTIQSYGDGDVNQNGFAKSHREFTAPEVTRNTTLTISFTATDHNGLSSTSTKTLTIVPAPTMGI